MGDKHVQMWFSKAQKIDETFWWIHCKIGQTWNEKCLVTWCQVEIATYEAYLARWAHIHSKKTIEIKTTVFRSPPQWENSNRQNLTKIVKTPVSRRLISQMIVKTPKFWTQNGHMTHKRTFYGFILRIYCKIASLGAIYLTNDCQTPIFRDTGITKIVITKIVNTPKFGLCIKLKMASALKASPTNLTNLVKTSSFALKISSSWNCHKRHTCTPENIFILKK